VEVAYSIIRRRQQRRSPGEADRHHLHSLVATHIVQPRLLHLHPNLRNAAVSVVMWVCAVVPVVPAIFFPGRPDILVPCLVGCFVAYHLFYRGVTTVATRHEMEALHDEDAAADAPT
jgi:hypothetical protein